MTDTPDLQPRTNGAGSSEFGMTRWGLIGFVTIVGLEVVVNAAMQYLTEQPYDAISETMFFAIGSVLVGGPLGYTTARTVKKGTLAKTAAGIDPFVIKKLGESIVAAAKGAVK